ncbi:MAG: carbohydrate ABC transporter permease, partial [Bullifex sp.]
MEALTDTQKRLRKYRIRKTCYRALTYIFLTLIGIIMVYPLLWIVSAAFKTNNEIFSSASLIPKEILWNGFTDGWKGVGQYSFGVFFSNTFKMVIP